MHGCRAPQNHKSWDAKSSVFRIIAYGSLSDDVGVEAFQETPIDLNYFSSFYLGLWNCDYHKETITNCSLPHRLHHFVPGSLCLSMYLSKDT